MPNAAEVAELIIEEGVKIVTTGAGSPAKYMEAWKAAGIKIVPVIASVAMAVKMQRAGADAVVAEGAESFDGFFGLFKSFVRSGVLNKQENGLNKNENKKEPRKVNLYTNKWHARYNATPARKK